MGVDDEVSELLRDQGPLVTKEMLQQANDRAWIEDDLGSGFWKWSTVNPGQDVKLKILEPPREEPDKFREGKMRWVVTAEVDGTGVYTVPLSKTLRRAFAAWIGKRALSYPMEAIVTRSGMGMQTRWTVRDAPSPGGR